MTLSAGQNMEATDLFYDAIFRIQNGRSRLFCFMTLSSGQNMEAADSSVL
jgi:hypothetical protein